MTSLRWLYRTMAFAFIAALVCSGGVAAQQPEKAAPGAEPDDNEKFKVSKPTYTYKSIGKRDPFRSLIQTVDTTEEDEEDGRVRSPIEQYNVSQLKLIAVVSSTDNAYALVVVPDGKSYTVTEGMNIGLHDGIVKEIRSDQVVVEVEVKDHKGNKKMEEVFLRLRKEEDK